MPRNYDWPAVAGSFAIACLGSALHCSRTAGLHPWGDALPSIYCIPILIAAIRLGMGSALGVALVSGLFCLGISWWGCGEFWPGSLIETALFIVIAVASARLTQLPNPLTQARQASAQTQPAENLTELHHPPHPAREQAALGQILAALVHRFRTPLASIEGAVELLDDRRLLENKRQEFIRIIRKEAQQLDRELCDVLDFAQPRRPQWRKVNVAELLDDVIRHIGPQYQPDFRFRKEIKPDLPLLRCDSDQISKLVFNLLMNAIQASPSGGQIVIRGNVEGDTFVLSIMDQGRGIAPTIASRIFDPFFTNRENALGLGLTVAKQIVNSHCGNITVTESTAKGTSISVRLPLTPLDPHEHSPYSGG